MNDLISVIIPVYKVEPYLRDCLDSVLASTHRDLEIILVDDGSPDNSGAICDEYAARDNRIAVIHQVNQGLSAARNAGLERATGEYIGFVDSDDVISPVMYERLLWAMRITNADMAACEFTRTEKQLDTTCMVTEEQLHQVVGFSDCLSVVIGAPPSRAFTWTYCTVWNKLYRKEKMLEFVVGLSPSEDMLFNYWYVQNADKLVVIPRCMYFYRNNPMSIMNSLSIKKSMCSVYAWNYLADNSQNIDPSLKRYLLGMSGYQAHNVSWRIVRSGEEEAYAEFVEQAQNRVRRCFKEIMLCQDVQWKVRIPAVLCRYCYPIWKIAAKIHHK